MLDHTISEMSSYVRFHSHLSQGGECCFWLNSLSSLTFLWSTNQFNLPMRKFSTGFNWELLCPGRTAPLLLWPKKLQQTQHSPVFFSEGFGGINWWRKDVCLFLKSWGELFALSAMALPFPVNYCQLWKAHSLLPATHCAFAVGRGGMKEGGILIEKIGLGLQGHNKVSGSVWTAIYFVSSSYSLSDMWKLQMPVSQCVTVTHSIPNK